MKESAKEMVSRIVRGTAEVTPLDEFGTKCASGRRLVVKLGADPTAPDLHLGHAVVLQKLREFQDLGHEAVFVIGDFTARIGDSTGRSKTRPPLTDAEIEHNSKTYFAQVGKILDASKITVRYNSEWLAGVSTAEWIKICAHFTVARLIEREDFATRLRDNQPVSFHELLYPILQGYDSVALRADVELGGTDQTFNLLFGRMLQEQSGQEPQVIVTMPLLEGVGGVTKMSKSQGNAIGLAEPADQAFGKLMSISDELMWQYKRLLLGAEAETIRTERDAVLRGEAHPMVVKKNIAHAIVARFWGSTEADLAQEQFESIFQKRNFDVVPPLVLPVGTPNPVWIVDLVKLVAGCGSSSEARRLIEAGAVAINEKKVLDPKAYVHLASGTLIKVGKHHHYRLEIR